MAGMSAEFTRFLSARQKSFSVSSGISCRRFQRFRASIPPQRGFAFHFQIYARSIHSRNFVKRSSFCGGSKGVSTRSLISSDSSRPRNHAHSEGSRLGRPRPCQASSRAIELLLGQSLQPHHEHRNFDVSMACAPRLWVIVVLPNRDCGIQVAARIRAVREGLAKFDKFHNQSHGLVALHMKQAPRSCFTAAASPHTSPHTR